MSTPQRIYQSLHRFYDQRGVPGAPWPVLNKLSDDELEKHLELNRWLEGVSEPNTGQQAHTRIFAGWISHAMMIRRFRSEFPLIAR